MSTTEAWRRYPPNWIAVVSEDGAKMRLDRPDDFRAYLKKFAADQVVITVRRRPRAQGAQACGYADPDDYESVHDALAWKFLRLSDHPQLGTPRRRSTAKADLTQEELSAFIDQCIVWA